ncbi:transcription factor domain-containing protein, partial [Trichoderma sp. SZMC 28013]
PLPAVQFAQQRRLLGTEDSIRSFTSEFFRTVHKWLPIVSKKYCHEYLISFPAACQPEIVLLLCCMKLLTTSADGESFEPRSSLYVATRRLSNELEDMGIFSLQALQAKVLLAYYELGHAIYPAAYLATGYCAKYGITLGLHNTSFQAEATFSPDEIEQRRRTWWAILVLERFIRLGYPDHVLLTPEPNIWDNLPTDDDVWDNQVIITSTMRLTAADVF